MLNIYQALGQQHGVAVDLEQAAIALAFHDIGLWTAGTLDYLPPSHQEAAQYCAAQQISNPTHILLMIDEHLDILPDLRSTAS